MTLILVVAGVTLLGLLSLGLLIVIANVLLRGF